MLRFSTFFVNIFCVVIFYFLLNKNGILLVIANLLFQQGKIVFLKFYLMKVNLGIIVIWRKDGFHEGLYTDTDDSIVKGEDQRYFYSIIYYYYQWESVTCFMYYKWLYFEIINDWGKITNNNDIILQKETVFVMTSNSKSKGTMAPNTTSKSNDFLENFGTMKDTILKVNIYFDYHYLAESP